jgi:hypothetical protein
MRFVEAHPSIGSPRLKIEIAKIAYISDIRRFDPSATAMPNQRWLSLQVNSARAAGNLCEWLPCRRNFCAEGAPKKRGSSCIAWVGWIHRWSPGLIARSSILSRRNLTLVISDQAFAETGN